MDNTPIFSPIPGISKAVNTKTPIIHEGKNRIIRRMFDFLGIKVLTLQRIKVGKLSLGDLKIGK